MSRSPLADSAYPEGAAPRVLCYSPYNRWALHGQWEMTVLHGLRHRGADVRYVLCDGQFTDCDVFWAAADPRPANACELCQAGVTNLVRSMGMDFEWLGRHVTMDERLEARRWERSLAPEELAAAAYGDWPVAAWIRGSVHSHFRSSRLDLSRPEVEAGFRSYLYSGLVACFGLTRLLDDTDPDVLFLFNGRQSSTRVAFELAQRRGLRTVVHERGPRAETMWMTVNEYCIALGPYPRYWEEWGDVPLTLEELEAVHGLLLEREHGREIAWKAFSPPPQPLAAVRDALGLEEERPVWVLFTSSDDELASEDDWGGPFGNQLEWIERTIAYAASHPEVDLVIRVHPNTGSDRSTGANVGQLEQMRRLSEELPANVRMVTPTEQVSSYSLMRLAAAGLYYHSTVGLELACLGKAAVAAAGSATSGLPFVRTVEDSAGYEARLDELLDLPAGHWSPEIRRLAYRFAYGRFFRMGVPFPLVHMPDPHTGVLRWRSTEELRPGLDAGLDRACRIVLDGEPQCVAPTAAERLSRTEEAEDEFFAPRPRVSVVIPCFNYADYLEEAVESVLAQSFRDFEVLIVDDGSTDDSLAIAKRLAEEHPQVTAITQENSGQPAYPRNNGVGRARGEFVMCLDADDAIEPEMLAECVAILDRHPEAGFAYPRQQNFGAENGDSPHVDWDAGRLARFNFVPTSSLYRRSAWEAVGGYRTNVRGYEDWDFWLGCVAAGLGGVPARGATWLYRIHEGSLYGATESRDVERKAQIMLNNPTLFTPPQLAWARDALAGDPEAVAASGGIGIMPAGLGWAGALRIAVGGDAGEHDWRLELDDGHVAESPWADATLQEAIERVDRLGYTAILFERPDGAPAPAARGRRTGAAEERAFPIPFVVRAEGADWDADGVRARLLGRAAQDLLIAQSLRRFDPAGVPLDAALTARYTALDAGALDEATKAIGQLAALAAADAELPPMYERTAESLADVARVAAAERMLAADQAGAHAARRLEERLRAPAPVDGARRFTALAFADELIGEPDLLARYGETFDGGDDATLVIVAPGAGQELLDAVSGAGLDGEGTADLLAVAEPARSVDALYTRRTPPARLSAVPRFDDGSVQELRELAESRWREAA